MNNISSFSVHFNKDFTKMKRSFKSFVLLLSFLGANCVTCANDNRTTNCSTINVRFNQTKFKVEMRKMNKQEKFEISRGFQPSLESNENCRLEGNQALHIELERLTRVYRVGIHHNVTRNNGGKLTVIATRYESHNHITKLTCIRMADVRDKYHEYFECAKLESNGIYIDSVRIILNNESDPIDLHLNLNNVNKTWIYLLDYGCQNLTSEAVGKQPPDYCKPKTCKPPIFSGDWEWRYLNDSLYKNVSYSSATCKEQYQIKGGNSNADKDNGSATCNFTTNSWEGVPECELVTTTTTKIQATSATTTTTIATSTTHTSDNSTALSNHLMYALSGVIALVLIIIVTIVICVRKKSGSLAYNEENAQNEQPVYAKVSKSKSKHNPEPVYENTSQKCLVTNEEPLYSDASIVAPAPVLSQSLPSTNELIYCELSFNQGNGIAKAIIQVPTEEETLYASIHNG